MQDQLYLLQQKPLQFKTGHKNHRPFHKLPRVLFTSSFIERISHGQMQAILKSDPCSVVLGGFQIGSSKGEGSLEGEPVSALFVLFLNLKLGKLFIILTVLGSTTLPYPFQWPGTPSNLLGVLWLLHVLGW